VACRARELLHLSQRQGYAESVSFNAGREKMRRKFYLTKKQEDILDAAGERTLAMTNLRTGEVPNPNPLSEAWDALGRELGFDSTTVTFDDTDEGIEAEVV
jgi:hypothetical protein